MKGCSAQSHFHLTLVEERKGYVPLLFRFSLIFFFVILWTSSRRQLWKSLLHCPGLYRDLNHLPKGFYEGLAPICPSENHWTVLEPSYIIFVYVQGWKEERSRTPGGMKGRRTPLCLPCRSLTWPACTQPQMYRKFCCPARTAKGFPFCPESRCCLQRWGAARRDFVFRKSLLIPEFCRGQPVHTQSLCGASHPAFSTPFPEELWFAGLCIPIIWKRHRYRARVNVWWDFELNIEVKGS